MQLTRLPTLLLVLLGWLATLITNSSFWTATVPLTLFPWSAVLAVLVLRDPRRTALWKGLACGLLLDFQTSEMPIGTWALIFSIATFIGSSQRHHFFPDKAPSFALFVAGLSALSTGIYSLTCHLLDKKILLSYHTIITDWILAPTLDGLTALVWLYAPVAAWQRGYPFLLRRIRTYREQKS